jgi:hypothetical protein
MWLLPLTLRYTKFGLSHILHDSGHSCHEPHLSGSASEGQNVRHGLNHFGFCPGQHFKLRIPLTVSGKRILFLVKTEKHHGD